MNKRCYIELSHNDTGLVSYFPGLEIKDEPDADWVDEALIPAIEPIARRKSKNIKSVPLTFWITIRKTARRPAEIIVFVTPAFPGSLIEDALIKALEPLKGGKVNAARESLSENALPCLQIFRGKLIRLYTTFDKQEGFYLPVVTWKHALPSLSLSSFSEDAELFRVEGPVDEAEKFMAEARIDAITSGEYCRRFQQALLTVARTVAV